MANHHLDNRYLKNICTEFSKILVLMHNSPFWSKCYKMYCNW